MFEHFGCTQLTDGGTLNVSPPCELLVSGQIPAVFNGDGKVVRESVRLQGWEGQSPDSVPEKLSSNHPVSWDHVEDVIWGGTIVNHYGHFLTESVSRLWAVLPDAIQGGWPVVFVKEPRFAFVSEWLDAFGVSWLSPPAEGITRFRSMAVPEPAWRLNAWVSPEMRDIHLHARDNLKVASCPKMDLVWLSRSGLRRSRAPYDEALLEWLLGDHITVVRPEDHSLAEQVGIVEASETIVGLIGSAFHTMLLCRNVPRCIYVCPSKFQSAHLAQCELLGTDATFTLGLATMRMRHQKPVKSPGEHRLLIPEILRIVNSMVQPDLLDDPRLAKFAFPESAYVRGIGPSCEIDRLITSVLLDPLNFWSRMRLGKVFEEMGVHRCALEQYLTVAELAEGYIKAPLLAARLLSGENRQNEAREMAQRILHISPDCAEAKAYLGR